MLTGLPYTEKRKAIVDLLQAAWFAKIGTAELTTWLHDVQRDGVVTGLVYIAANDMDYENSSKVLVNLYTYADLQQVGKAQGKPVVIVVLFDKEVRFVELSKIVITDSVIVSVERLPYVEIGTELFKHVGYVIPRSDTRYRD